MQSKISIYNVRRQKDDHKRKDIFVTPKIFPEKTIVIVFPVQQLLVKIFLNTKTKKWDSNINYNDINVKLSHDQMNQFFTSHFYKKLMSKLQRDGLIN
jgi:hypothetical protein